MEQTLSLLLCDDDDLFRESLKDFLFTCFQNQHMKISVRQAAGAAELSAELSHSSFDLIFLDIDMPGTDGIRLGQQLRDKGWQTDIIYISNYDERVYEIFTVHPWSFVRKSRYREELPGVISEYVRSIHHNRSLTLPGADGQLFAVKPEEIVYIEAAGKLQQLYLTHRTEALSIRSSLSELEQMTQSFGFIRIHKGFLVNFRFIQKITSRSVLMDNGLSIPIGRDRLKGARESYLSLMKWKGLAPDP